jgi:hypothetical protein
MAVEAKTIEELKALYRKLAFTHHPDLGGNTTTMQEINAEYEYRLKLLQSGQVGVVIAIQDPVLITSNYNRQ